MTHIISGSIDLAERGWPVIPMHNRTAGSCSCDKVNCKSPGKHPRIRTGRGHSAASNDPAQVSAWWRQWPNANIGMPTGSRTGIVVVDIDPRHSGDASLAALEDANEPLPRTVEAATGGGGTPVIFQHPGTPITCASIAQGVDIRADGKLIILPPSIHPSGGVYRWVRHPDVCEMAELPDWLLALMLKQRRAAA